jgi:PAS domain S-box-containing protein
MNLETKVEQENEIYRHLVDSVNDYAIFSLDREGYIQTWNQGAERIKGYKPHEIIGQHFSKFYTPEDLQAGKTAMELRIAREEGRYEEEGWRVRKDGTLFWANVVITALYNDDKTLRGFAKVTRDLTSKKQAEEVLKQSQERYRLLIDSVKDYALIMLDTKGRITSWNAGAQRIKGYSAEEILGSHFSKFYPEIDIAAGKPEMELKVAIAEGRFEEEGIRVKKDGSFFWASVVITAVRDESGALRGFSKVTRDISERKNAERKMRELNESLEKKVSERTIELTSAVRARDEFLSMASHELNTPLTALKLKSQMRQKILEKQGTNYFNEKMLGQMFKDDEVHVNRLTRLVDDMMDITRLGSSKLSVRKETINLCDHVEGIAKRYKPQLQEARCEFTLNSACEINGSWDPYRVEQIVTNLLTNAMKYGQGKPVIVNVSSNAQEAVISVQDFGKGIASEDQERVFQQFERAGEISEISGLGLGLYIVKKIVELHNGNITLVSELGKGSTFTVKLPLE